MNEEIDPKIVESSPSNPNDVTPTPNLSRGKTIGQIIGVIIILALMGGGIWYWQHKANTASPDGMINYPIGDKNSQPTEPAQAPNLTDGSFFAPPVLPVLDPLNSNPKPNTNVQWKTPTTLADLKLVAAVGPENNGSVKYFDMGTHGTNKIILAQAPAVDPSGPANYFFEQTVKGYMFMQLMSSTDVYRSVDSPGDYFISPTVTTADTKIYYQGLVGPTNLSWSGLDLQQPYLSPSDFFQSFVDGKKTVTGFTNKKITSVNEGDLYLFQQETGGDNGSSEKFLLKRYVLKLPSGFYTDYSVSYKFLSDNRVPNITWADSSKNKDSYRPDGSGGCGNPGAYVVSAKDISTALKITGTTNTNQSVYEFSDVHNPTLKYYYDQQNGQYYNQTTQQMESISIEQWYTHHPVIAVKNGVGDYVLMTNDAYGLAAECGKPVIYLYPTQPTNVSVKVGANISKSEPVYNNGWKVLAKPNGQLLTQENKTVDSLFWEGIGYGDYPNITEGFVVQHSELESVITTQLSALGLNNKESEDFKDFWMSKLPNSPYVRLTWFTTAQLDKLAPLYIQPKPNTVIRVFLDYKGLEKPISIPQQKLTAIPRNGFTVVEWGGLLRK